MTLHAEEIERKENLHTWDNDAQHKDQSFEKIILVIPGIEVSTTQGHLLLWKN